MNTEAPFDEELLRRFWRRLTEHTVRVMKDAAENPPPRIRTFKQFADRQRALRSTPSRRE